ncbi:hypothetical protein M0R45_027006 [Rubus argutus]|uniref:Reverse transcriptase zinc-binding domain n=1 Tax=Rubus argutus TaxID=59490 RepID=A0AAW1X1P9_RUBAR
MSCFKIPVTLCRAINSEIANFWWGQNEDSNNIHWQTWSKLYLRKGDGDISTTAISSKLKLDQDPPGLGAASWLEERLSVWVLDGRLIMERVFKFGKTYGFPIFQMVCCIFYQLVTGSPPSLLMRLWRKNPTVGELIISIPSYPTQKALLYINNITIGDASIDDRMIWPMEKSVKYTVRSGYYFLFNPITTIPKSSSSHRINKKVWSIIWGINTLPKIKHFLWRALSNSLPTGLNLFRRKLLKSPICTLCGEFEESVEHCILLCAWTECTWFGSSLGLHILKHGITTLDSWLLALANMSFPTSCTKQDMLSLFGFLAWNIWKTRCESVYNSTSPTPRQTINTATRHWQEFKQAKCGITKPTPSTPTPANVVWTPPLDHLIKINIDGAWDSTSQVRGSVIEAEATALVNGIKLAVQLNLDNVVLESDSQELITALDNPIERGNWRIYPFLTEFHRLRAALCNVSWRWISRQANRAADAGR